MVSGPASPAFCPAELSRGAPPPMLSTGRARCLVALATVCVFIMVGSLGDTPWNMFTRLGDAPPSDLGHYWRRDLHAGHPLGGTARVLMDASSEAKWPSFSDALFDDWDGCEYAGHPHAGYCQYMRVTHPNALDGFPSTDRPLLLYNVDRMEHGLAGYVLEAARFYLRAQVDGHAFVVDNFVSRNVENRLWICPRPDRPSQFSVADVPELRDRPLTYKDMFGVHLELPRQGFPGALSPATTGNSVVMVTDAVVDWPVAGQSKLRPFQSYAAFCFDRADLAQRPASCTQTPAVVDWDVLLQSLNECHGGPVSVDDVMHSAATQLFRPTTRSVAKMAQLLRALGLFAVSVTHDSEKSRSAVWDAREHFISVHLTWRDVSDILRIPIDGKGNGTPGNNNDNNYAWASTHTQLCRELRDACVLQECRAVVFVYQSLSLSGDGTATDPSRPPSLELASRLRAGYDALVNTFRRFTESNPLPSRPSVISVNPPAPGVHRKFAQGTACDTRVQEIDGVQQVDLVCGGVPTDEYRSTMPSRAGHTGFSKRHEPKANSFFPPKQRVPLSAPLYLPLPLPKWKVRTSDLAGKGSRVDVPVFRRVRGQAGAASQVQDVDPLLYEALTLWLHSMSQWTLGSFAAPAVQLLRYVHALPSAGQVWGGGGGVRDLHGRSWPLPPPPVPGSKDPVRVMGGSGAPSGFMAGWKPVGVAGNSQVPTLHVYARSHSSKYTRRLDAALSDMWRMEGMHPFSGPHTRLRGTLIARTHTTAWAQWLAPVADFYHVDATCLQTPSPHLSETTHDLEVCSRVAKAAVQRAVGWYKHAHSSLSNPNLRDGPLVPFDSNFAHSNRSPSQPQASPTYLFTVGQPYSGARELSHILRRLPHYSRRPGFTTVSRQFGFLSMDKITPQDSAVRSLVVVQDAVLNALVGDTAWYVRGTSALPSDFFHEVVEQMMDRVQFLDTLTQRSGGTEAHSFAAGTRVVVLVTPTYLSDRTANANGRERFLEVHPRDTFHSYKFPSISAILTNLQKAGLFVDVRTVQVDRPVDDIIGAYYMDRDGTGMGPFAGEPVPMDLAGQPGASTHATATTSSNANSASIGTGKQGKGAMQFPTDLPLANLPTKVRSWVKRGARLYSPELYIAERMIEGQPNQNMHDQGGGFFLESLRIRYGTLGGGLRGLSPSTLLRVRHRELFPGSSDFQRPPEERVARTMEFADKPCPAPTPPDSREQHQQAQAQHLARRLLAFLSVDPVFTPVLASALQVGVDHVLLECPGAAQYLPAPHDLSYASHLCADHPQSCVEHATRDLNGVVRWRLRHLQQSASELHPGRYLAEPSAALASDDQIVCSGAHALQPPDAEGQLHRSAAQLAIERVFASIRAVHAGTADPLHHHTREYRAVAGNADFDFLRHRETGVDLNRLDLSPRLAGIRMLATQLFRAMVLPEVVRLLQCHPSVPRAVCDQLHARGHHQRDVKFPVYIYPRTRGYQAASFSQVLRELTMTLSYALRKGGVLVTGTMHSRARDTASWTACGLHGCRWPGGTNGGQQESLQFPWTRTLTRHSHSGMLSFRGQRAGSAPSSAGGFVRAVNTFHYQLMEAMNAQPVLSAFGRAFVEVFSEPSVSQPFELAGTLAALPSQRGPLDLLVAPQPISRLEYIRVLSGLVWRRVRQAYGPATPLVTGTTTLQPAAPALEGATKAGVLTVSLTGHLSGSYSPTQLAQAIGQVVARRDVNTVLLVTEPLEYRERIALPTATSANLEQCEPALLQAQRQSQDLFAFSDYDCVVSKLGGPGAGAVLDVQTPMHYLTKLVRLLRELPLPDHRAQFPSRQLNAASNLVGVDVVLLPSTNIARQTVFWLQEGPEAPARHATCVSGWMRVADSSKRQGALIIPCDSEQQQQEQQQHPASFKQWLVTEMELSQRFGRGHISSGGFDSRSHLLEETHCPAPRRFLTASAEAGLAPSMFPAGCGSRLSVTGQLFDLYAQTYHMYAPGLHPTHPLMHANGRGGLKIPTTHSKDLIVPALAAEITSRTFSTGGEYDLPVPVDDSVPGGMDWVGGVLAVPVAQTEQSSAPQHWYIPFYGGGTLAVPPRLAKRTFTSPLRVISVVGLEGTGHHLFFEMWPATNVHFPEPDLERLFWYAVVSANARQSDAQWQTVRRKLTRLKRDADQAARGQSRVQLRMLASNTGPEEPVGMQSYPNYGGYISMLQSPDVVPLALLCEELGVDYRILHTTRHVGLAVTSVVNRGFNGNLYRDQRRNQIYHMFMHHLSLQTVEQQLAQLDPAFFHRADLAMVGEIPALSVAAVAYVAGTGINVPADWDQVTRPYLRHYYGDARGDPPHQPDEHGVRIVSPLHVDKVRAWLDVSSKRVKDAQRFRTMGGKIFMESDRFVWKNQRNGYNWMYAPDPQERWEGVEARGLYYLPQPRLHAYSMNMGTCVDLTTSEYIEYFWGDLQSIDSMYGLSYWPPPDKKRKHHH